MLRLEGRVAIRVGAQEMILDMRGSDVTLEVPQPLALWRAVGILRLPRTFFGVRRLVRRYGLQLHVTRNGKPLVSLRGPRT